MKTLCVLILAGLFMFMSCSEENTFEPTCNGISSTFATDVQPIINVNCTNSGCHGSGSSNGPGALTTYAQISSAKNSISSAIKSGRMPKNGSLSTDEKNKILCWIQNGALNN